MSFLASQRLVWWRLVLTALVIGAWSCGNDTPGDGTSVSAPSTTVTFGAPVHLGVNDVGESGDPRIAVGQGTTLVTAWATPAGVSAQRSTDSGATWSAPIVIDDTLHGFVPDLACDRHGVCVAIWKVVSPVDAENDVFAARSADDGATWSAPVLLSRAGVLEAFTTEPAIATDGGGTWVVVWDAADLASGANVFTTNFRVESVTSSDGALTWDAPETVSPSSAAGFDPKIAADGTGHWVASFDSIVGDTEHPPFSKRVVAVRSIDGRAWSEPVVVGALDPRNNSNRESNGDLGTDGAGTWHVVWTGQRRDEEAGGDFQEVVTARSVDGGATWSVPQQLDTPGASTVDFFSALTADAEGHVVVVWLSSLEANRMQLLTVQSADGGVTWSAPSEFPGGAANPQIDGLPDVDLATDHRGAWTAVWALASPGAHTIEEPHDVVVARGATTTAD